MPNAIETPNATLIAAAPDLLEIAKRVVGMAKARDRSYDTEFQELAQAAFLAMEKALGAP